MIQLNIQNQKCFACCFQEGVLNFCDEECTKNLFDFTSEETSLRMTYIINVMREYLLLDELHTIVDKGKGGADACLQLTVKSSTQN